MVLMFRKWVFPSFKRRWYGKYYDEFQGDYQTGFYRDGVSFTYNKIMSFATRLIDEGKALEYAINADWDTMLDSEKENVRRFTTEFGILLTVVALSAVLSRLDSGDDDDELVLKNIDYQLFRLQTDLMFYFNPRDAFRILQSPIPSTSIIRSATNLLDQIFNPTEKFQKGRWKDHYKIEKRVYDLIPVIRQIYRARDIITERELLELR